MSLRNEEFTWRSSPTWERNWKRNKTLSLKDCRDRDNTIATARRQVAQRQGN